MIFEKKIKLNTEILPHDLVEKLKAADMRISIDHDTERTDATFVACFNRVNDGILTSICRKENSAGLDWFPMVTGKSSYTVDGKE